MNPRPMRVLTEDEEARLCRALGQPYALWVQFAIATGLKQSQQFSLRWQQVDVERAMMVLPHRSPGAMVELPLSQTAVQILRALKSLQTKSVWVFPDGRNRFQPVDIHRVYTLRWAAAVRRAKIPWVAWKICAIRAACASPTPESRCLTSFT